MIDVLTEISLLHAARNYNKQKLENIGVDPDTYIYEKFNIDSIQFERSSDWYSEQYSEYEGIYDSVKARLQMMKTKLDSVRDIEVKMEDSIKQAKKDPAEVVDSLKNDSINQREFKELSRDQKDSLIDPPLSNQQTLN